MNQQGVSRTAHPPLKIGGNFQGIPRTYEPGVTDYIVVLVNLRATNEPSYFN